tara:strand:+ start:105 stop:341 length:237 start_codon:yes stop_codon:yes gene_type:complete
MKADQEKLTETLISNVVNTQQKWWNAPTQLTDYLNELFDSMFRFEIMATYEPDSNNIEVHYNDPITEQHKLLKFLWKN